MGSANKSSSGSNTYDMTPEAFQNMQQPFADVLQGLFQSPPSYQGNVKSSLGFDERNSLAELNAPNNRANIGSEQGISTLTNTAKNPNMQSVGFNPTAAREQAGRLFDSQSAPGYAEGPSTAVGYDPRGTVEGFGGRFQNAVGDVGQYSTSDGNPFLKSSIDAATRPILENLTQTTQRDLPGRFAQAGQFTSPQGSSAFDRAAAVATTGAANAIGDVSSRLSGASYEAERGREFEAQQADRSRQAQAVSDEYARRGEFGEAARMRAQAANEAVANRGFMSGEAGRAWDRGNLTSINDRNASFGENARAREQAAQQAGLDRQQQAAGELPQIKTTEINNLISKLQANALPRLVEEGNIDRGTQQFQQQIDNLLQALGIGAAVTRPVVGQSSSSKSKGGSIAPPAPAP